MRTWWCLAAGLVLAAAGAGQADEQAELKGLVEKGIKAVGGADKLAKFKSATWKAKGTLTVENMELQFTTEASWQAFAQARLDMDATVQGNMIKALIVLNGEQAWAKVMERVEDAPKEVIAVLKADMYALRLVQTLLPLKDAAYKLSPMGEVQVGDKPAVGVKVAHKDHPEVNLWFDKATGLPVKCDLQVKDMQGMPEALHEFFFSEPKETDGVKHFMKVVLHRDGKKLMEVELSEVKAAENLDANLFAKP